LPASSQIQRYGLADFLSIAAIGFAAAKYRARPFDLRSSTKSVLSIEITSGVAA
jgi:hypothetical protein